MYQRAYLKGRIAATFSSMVSSHVLVKIWLYHDSFIRDIKIQLKFIISGECDHKYCNPHHSTFLCSFDKEKEKINSYCCVKNNKNTCPNFIIFFHKSEKPISYHYTNWRPSFNHLCRYHQQNSLLNSTTIGKLFSHFDFSPKYIRSDCIIPVWMFQFHL